jgi:quercetin dioxygenase-like cupin family protein
MKTHTRIAAAAPLFILIGIASQAAISQEVRLGDIGRTNLMKEELSIPGRQVIQVRVDVPPGGSAVRHSHPGEELVYVIEGALEYHLDGRAPVTLKAGEVLFIPYGTPHAVRNVGSGNAAELATYIVEKNQPLSALSD